MHDGMSDYPSKPKFNPGDVVQLKSGGKTMTVKCEVDEAAARNAYSHMEIGIVCDWHDDAGIPQQETFVAEQLTKVSGRNPRDEFAAVERFLDAGKPLSALNFAREMVKEYS